jgi:hypothetical protein
LPIFSFQERILPIKGGVDFLKAVGFIELDEANEKYLFLLDVDISKLQEGLDNLKNGEPIPLKLSRDLKVLFH